MDNRGRESEQVKQTPTEASNGFLRALGDNVNRILKNDLAVVSGSYFGVVASAMAIGMGIGFNNQLSFALGLLATSVSGGVMLHGVGSMAEKNKKLERQVSGLESQQPGINRTSANSTLQQK